jgi:hypothetical protein
MSDAKAKKNDPDIEALREQARSALKDLTGLCHDEDVSAAKRLVESLRDIRDFELMARLAEVVSRRDPKDARNRRLYAQSLIETGMATAAIDVLRILTRRLPKSDPEYSEATGLLGRAYKQIFFDADDKTSPGVRLALKQAIQAYRDPFLENPANTWHGVNLLALIARARRLGLRISPDLHPKEIATQVMEQLGKTPSDERDEWFLPTLAEASLGLDDWEQVEHNVRAYVASDRVQAFHVASTLRQFTDIWDLESLDDRGKSLVDILRARLVQLPGGELQLGGDELQRLREAPPPEAGQLEAVLGEKGPETYLWWRTGLDRAVSVAAIRRRLGGRIGTGFLVRAGDLGLEPNDELLVVTNFHVVNEHGASPGVEPEDAEIVFEATAPDTAYQVERILWSSPDNEHDASILRLTQPVQGIDPLPIARALPAMEEGVRVYIIGHPGGRDLAFSFQDNHLLDHEGPPKGRPQIPGVCRVHYHAPTEGGSSGSPVFNSNSWQVIALHHKGGKMGMPLLNGKDGTYAANEGISIHSIIEAMAAQRH